MTLGSLRASILAAQTAFKAFSDKLNAFVEHAQKSNSVQQMDTARGDAHEALDVYMDEIASSHAVIREEGPKL